MEFCSNNIAKVFIPIEELGEEVLKILAIERRVVPISKVNHDQITSLRENAHVTIPLVEENHLVMLYLLHNRDQIDAILDLQDLLDEPHQQRESSFP